MAKLAEVEQALPLRVAVAYVFISAGWSMRSHTEYEGLPDLWSEMVLA